MKAVPLQAAFKVVACGKYTEASDKSVRGSSKLDAEQSVASAMTMSISSNACNDDVKIDIDSKQVDPRLQH